MKTTIINKILLVLMLITAQQVSALEFQVDGIYYRTSIFTKNSAYVTHSGTSYTESVEYQGEVVIPESVTYNGKTYTIASIGGYAFAGCPGLTSVTIPNTVTTINQNAFNGCTGLKTIECKATTPPALGDNAFTSYDATLVVPSSSESVYKSAAGWSNFKFKEEPSETPGSGENSGEDNTGGGSDSGEDSGSDNSGSDNTYGLACKILNSTDVAIIAGTEKYTGDIVIPSQVTISGKTYTVTSIANDAFKGCTGLTSITIPSSITSIGSSAFDSCNNLNKVNISDILSWCKITFANSLANPLYYAKKLYLNGTLVTKLEIPSTITKIKNYTFYNCTSISTIVFPSGILKIGNSAFVNCSNLTSVTIPNSVTTIDENAFNGCIGLTSLTIGSSVGSIGNYAFGNCTGLKSVTSLNSTPPTCGTGVFQGVTISSIPLTVPAGSESLYKATYTWQDFKYKEESENPGDDPAVDTSGLKYNIISSTDVEVVAGTEKYTGDIVIPSQTAIDGKVYNVTKVGNKAFYNCTGLTSVIIGNSVTSIGYGAFNSCSGLTSITIPNSVSSIEAYAFCVCDGLTSITIPNSVTSIGKYAFYGCSGLTSVTIPNSVISIGDDVFSSCSGLKSIIVESGNTVYDSRNNCNAIIETSTNTLITGCKNTVIPNSITSIGNAAFVDCSGLTSVTIGNSVTNIGNYAFLGCTGLTSITIPNSVNNIGTSAFRDCSGLTSITIPEGASIGSWAFSGCNRLTSVTSLNPTPPTCGTDVFESVNVGNITLEVPSESISLYQSADTWKDFGTIKGISEEEPELPTDNSGLSYNILNSTEVEVIAGAEKYTGDIVIPSQTTIDGKVYNVTQIGTKSFYGCTGLKSVIIGNNVTLIEENAFEICTGLISVTIGNKVEVIDVNAFKNCTQLTSVIIPNSVTSIGTFSFYNCAALKSVTIGNRVTNIWSFAFENCTGLESITSLNPTPPACSENVFGYVDVSKVALIVPSGSESLYKTTEPWKNFKFEGDSEEPSDDPAVDTSGLKYNIISSTDVEVIAGAEKYTGDIVIPSQTTIDGKVYNVTQIGDAAFQDCTNLTSVTIPNSVTSIGYETFSGCRDLSSITIPNSVTSIGNSAFLGCSGLTSITISERVTIIGESAFSDCSGLESIYVESENTVYDSRDNCNAIIEKSTNKLITGCKNSVIPNSVTSIGSWAFSGCSGLTRITIPNSVTSIGSRAFSGCSGLTRITIPNSVTSIGSSAFVGCSGLTSVTIGNSVTSIGNYAFSRCDGLTSVTSLNPTPPTCGTDVFYNVSVGNITLEVPAGSVSLYQSADTWKDFGTIETYISYPVGLSKMWAIPFDPSTGYCSVRAANGFGDTLYGANNTAGTIEEWKDGVLVASYDVNKFCADNELGEIVKVKDEAGNETEKFQSYLLWTAVMVDDAGNVLANVGLGAGSATTCQNWVLLPASDRNAMQLLHIDEFPSIDVVKGRVDVPSRIVGNITDGGAYLYIPALGSALMPVMYIALDGNGKIYYDAENSWTLMSANTFDTLTNVATFQTAEDILNATDEAGVAAKTYIRWRVQDAPFTWNAETSQFEKNESFVPGVVGTPGMDVFKIGEIEYIVLPVKSATTGSRGSSVAVYSLADGTEVASWDATSAVDYYVGSVQARVNPDGKTANIYVCGHKDCFGILKFYPGSSVKSIANEGLSYGKGSSALDEIVTEENTDVEYYNLQGVRVMNPEKGIYIKRQGGKTSKVVL